MTPNKDLSQPAKNLEDLLDLFERDQNTELNEHFYVERQERGLNKLTRKLERNRRFKAFVCGHVGSGKTTELKRLKSDPKINALYQSVFISVDELNIDVVNLTHDALMLNIALQLMDQFAWLKADFESEINDWGNTLVQTIIDETNADAKLDAGIPNLWFVKFKASLKYRHNMKEEQKRNLEPKVADLIEILDRMALAFNEKEQKHLLVMVDDLEKGSTDNHKQMHQRLFSEFYSILTGPSFNIIYTIPVYFKSTKNHRIESQDIYSFPACRLYDIEQKNEDKPTLDVNSQGYQLVKNFILQRIDSNVELFEEGVLDELILIGGGLFRDTENAIVDAVESALDRDSDTINLDDCKIIFDELKKKYQPAITGRTKEVLQQIMQIKDGWVEDVEPLLQSRAVLEYENGDTWLDVRYVLKAHINKLVAAETKADTE